MNNKLVIKNLPKHNSTVTSFFLSISKFCSENLTKEQYSNQIVPRNVHALSVSRDTLNPLLNTAILKERLADIEFFKYRYGVELARWPHFALGRLGKHLYRYKFNYGVKAFAAYVIYKDVINFKHMRT